MHSLKTRRLTVKFWLPITCLAIFIIAFLSTVRIPAIPVTRAGIEEPSLLAQQQIVKIDPLHNLLNSSYNGDKATLVGVDAPGEFSFPVVQQPNGDTVFVSTDPGVVTQFRAASRFGTVGLLAHNSLAGATFTDLSVGDRILLVYGDNSVRPYTVSSIQEFQALDPSNPYSDFIDFAHGNQKLNSQSLFNRIYSQPDQLVFQTCIEKDGEASWGRVFITATPDQKQTASLRPNFWQVYSLY